MAGTDFFSRETVIKGSEFYERYSSIISSYAARSMSVPSPTPAIEQYEEIKQSQLSALKKAIDTGSPKLGYRGYIPYIAGQGSFLLADGGMNYFILSGRDASNKFRCRDCSVGCIGNCSGTCVSSCSSDSCSKGCNDGCSSCTHNCGSNTCTSCDGCSGCGESCSDDCDNTCSGGCSGCGGACSNNCSGGCSGGCRGDACKGTCSAYCAPGCSGGCGTGECGQGAARASRSFDCADTCGISCLGGARDQETRSFLKKTASLEEIDF